MTHDKKQWGGARQGAGRPRLDEQAETKARTVTAPEYIVDDIIEIGEGNFSRGVRRLWQIWIESNLTEKQS